MPDEGSKNTEKFNPMKRQKIIKNDTLFDDISSLIIESRSLVAYTVNSALTILNWRIGNRIKEDILKSKRAQYGEEIISTLSKQLTQVYGKGWSKQQLWNCLYTVETFPDFQIVSTLSGELSWLLQQKLHNAIEVSKKRLEIE